MSTGNRQRKPVKPVEAPSGRLPENSEAWLRSALEQSHTGVWDYDLATLDALHSLEHDRIFGYDTRLPSWTYPMLLAHVFQEDREAVDRSFQEAATTGTGWNTECRIRRRDGEIRWIRLDGGPRGEVFPLGHLTGSLRDITEQKQALQRSEAITKAYADLYHHAPFGYHSIDAVGTIIAMNDTELAMHGYTREEVIGRMNIRQLLPLARRLQFAEDFKAFMRLGSVRNIESTFLRKDGSEFPVLLSANAKFDVNGALLHSLTTVIDDTQRREALEALQHSRRDLERRVVERTGQVRKLAEDVTRAEERERHAIAHDLHDGLGQLLFAAGLRVDDLARITDPEGAAWNLVQGLRETLTDARKQLRSITSQLSPLVLETLGLVAALSWLSDEMERTYGLVVETVDEGGTEALSPTAAVILYRVVRELLINVVKHAGVRSATVLIACEDDQVSIQVEDNGLGIAQVEAIFESDQTHGLRAIRERLTYLGGSVRIWSHPGNGTTVALKVPVTPNTPLEVLP